MFSIYDGRTQFYQWDLDRKLVVNDPTIEKVHFCNRTGACSLVRCVYEVNGMFLVDVPNIILQESYRVNVYGFDANYTKHSQSFNIVARTRPEDYIYTEAEVAQWEALEARVTELEEKGVSDEVIAAAVDEYLAESPIIIEHGEGIAANTQSLESLERRVTTNEEDIVANSSAINKLSGNVDTWRAEQTKTINEHDEAITSLESQTSTLAGSVNAANLSIGTLNNTVIDHTNRIAALEAGGGSGSGEVNVDLTNYYTKSETDAAIKADKEILFVDISSTTPVTASVPYAEIVEALDNGKEVIAHVAVESNHIYMNLLARDENMIRFAAVMETQYVILAITSDDVVEQASGEYLDSVYLAQNYYTKDQTESVIRNIPTDLLILAQNIDNSTTITLDDGGYYSAAKSAIRDAKEVRLQVSTGYQDYHYCYTGASMEVEELYFSLVDNGIIRTAVVKGDGTVEFGVKEYYDKAGVDAAIIAYVGVIENGSY